MFNPRGSLAQESPELFTPVVHVVHDNPELSIGLDALLTSVGLKHRMYEGPEQFLTVMLSEGRGCIVVDLSLPGCSSLDLVRKIRQRELQLPLVILTAQSDILSTLHSLELKPVDLLLKPFTSQQFLEAVTKALALDRHRRRESYPPVHPIPRPHLMETATRTPTPKAS